ncbi:hypothetical protein C0J52_04154 [Blattella germanica]|nr:hypothetical protein C0J52_04154 [Blattella germanica]
MYISASVLCNMLFVFLLIGIMTGAPLVTEKESTVEELAKEIEDILKDLENQEPEEPILQNGRTESLPTFERQPIPVNDCPLCIPDVFKWH